MRGHVGKWSSQDVLLDRAAGNRDRAHRKHVTCESARVRRVCRLPLYARSVAPWCMHANCVLGLCGSSRGDVEPSLLEITCDSVGNHILPQRTGGQTRPLWTHATVETKIGSAPRRERGRFIPECMHAHAAGQTCRAQNSVPCKSKRSPENAIVCARVRASDRGRGPKRKRAGVKMSTPSREGTARGRGYLPTTARPRSSTGTPNPAEHTVRDERMGRYSTQGDVRLGGAGA